MEPHENRPNLPEHTSDQAALLDAAMEEAAQRLPGASADEMQQYALDLLVRKAHQRPDASSMDETATS